MRAPFAVISASLILGRACHRGPRPGRPARAEGHRDDLLHRSAVHRLDHRQHQVQDGFTSDNKMTREPVGKTGAKGEGTWRLSQDGFCSTWKGGRENCFRVRQAATTNGRWSPARWRSPTGRSDGRTLALPSKGKTALATDEPLLPRNLDELLHLIAGQRRREEFSCHRLGHDLVDADHRVGRHAVLRDQLAHPARSFPACWRTRRRSSAHPGRNTSSRSFPCRPG